MTSRIFTTTFALATTLVTAFALTGCSPGFTGQATSASLNGSSSAPTSGGSGSGGTTPGNAAQAWQNVSMDATTQTPTAGTVLTVTLDKPNQDLVIHLPLILPITGFTIGNTVTIPQLPGTTLGFETVGSNTVLTLRIPLSTVMHGASFLPNGQLPNGDSLATVGIPGGELPNLGISLNNSGTMKASIFLDPTVVGLFLTSPVNPYLNVGFAIKLANGTQIGTFSTVAAKGQYPGGFFVAVKVPNDIADIIDDIVD